MNKFERITAAIILAISAFFIGLGVFLSVKAHAEDIHKIVITEEKLLKFIEEHTDYDINIPPPKYVFKSKRELAEIYYQEKNLEGRLDILGLYNSGVITLNDEFELPRDDWQLLHELVHHVVFHNAIKFECTAAEERVAYNLQIKYVDMVGRGNKPNALFMAFLDCRATKNYH